MKLLQAYDSIAVELEGVRELFNQELISDVPAVADMIEQVGKFRGKMLRPMLVLASGKAAGNITERHRILAAVSEMVHMATLIHDDVLDEAETRRRGRTINALHGNEAAVILGDLFISHAFKLCSSIGRTWASNIIASTTNTICEGELLQLYHRGYYDLDEAKYIEIIERKTGQLMGTCCYLGARAAGASEAMCQELEEFGLNLGIAFQIMDDVMDIVGNEQTAGKTIHSDFEKEKMTLPTIHFLRQCPKQQRNRAIEILSNKQTSCYPELAKQLDRQGSIDYARQRASQYVEKARGAMPHTPEKQIHNLLQELAAFVLS